MPTIQVTVPENAWTKEQKAEIASKLTDSLNSVAESSGKGDIKQYISVHIKETSEGGYAIGGNVIG